MGACTSAHLQPEISHSTSFDPKHLFINKGNYIKIKCATNPSLQSWKWVQLIQTNEASGHLKVKYELFDDSFNEEWLHLDHIQYDVSAINNIVIYGFIRNFQMNNNLFMKTQPKIYENIITYSGDYLLESANIPTPKICVSCLTETSAKINLLNKYTHISYCSKKYKIFYKPYYSTCNKWINFYCNDTGIDYTLSTLESGT
eukprot:496363_1